jgi:hypothetical protein
MAIMKTLSTMFHDTTRRKLASALRHYITGPLATIAGAIVFVLVLAQGESWAIRQGPLMPSASCISDYSTDGEALPVSILH